VKFAWVSACLKAGLSDQQNASQKKKDQLWHLRVEYTCGLRR